MIFRIEAMVIVGKVRGGVLLDTLVLHSIKTNCVSKLGINNTHLKNIKKEKNTLWLLEYQLG